MELDLAEVTCKSEVTIWAKPTNAPETQMRWSDRRIQPQLIELRYTHQIQDVKSAWVCTDVKVAGPRVLKPGPDGTQRLGKESHWAHWYLVRGHFEDLPEWLPEVIINLRPAGYVELPGD